MGIEVKKLGQMSTAMDNAKALIAKKDEIEAQIRELEATLRMQGNVGMDQPLIDREGFPRSDIDLVAVRTARHSIIELTNDHKDIMKQIEAAILGLHQDNRTSKSQAVSSGTTSQAAAPTRNEPFARVNAVAPDSSAKEAGLIKDDLIVRFGTVHSGNHRMLQALSDVVKEGATVPVVVKRNDEIITLTLTPKRAGSQYTLG
ncbi:putative 26S proteasome regulatory subunit [Umbelopsis sp. WA50703]